MNSIKKIMFFVLMVIMMVNANMAVYAAEENKEIENKVIEIETPIASARNENITPTNVEIGTLTVELFRDGSTNRVQVYLRWVGEFPISAFKFDSIEIWSTSLLNKEYYGTISGKTSIVTSSTVAYAYLGDVYIPSDVEKARAVVSNIMVYAPLDGMWISGSVLNNTTIIN